MRSQERGVDLFALWSPFCAMSRKLTCHRCHGDATDSQDNVFIMGPDWEVRGPLYKLHSGALVYWLCAACVPDGTKHYERLREKEQPSTLTQVSPPPSSSENTGMRKEFWAFSPHGDW